MSDPRSGALMQTPPTPPSDGADETLMYTPELGKMRDEFTEALRRSTDLAKRLANYQGVVERQPVPAVAPEVLSIIERATLATAQHLIYNANGVELLAATRGCDASVRTHVAKVVRHYVEFGVGCLADLTDEVRAACDSELVEGGERARDYAEMFLLQTELLRRQLVRMSELAGRKDWS